MPQTPPTSSTSPPGQARMHAPHSRHREPQKPFGRGGSVPSFPLLVTINTCRCRRGASPRTDSDDRSCRSAGQLPWPRQHSSVYGRVVAKCGGRRRASGGLQCSEGAGVSHQLSCSSLSRCAEAKEEHEWGESGNSSRGEAVSETARCCRCRPRTPCRRMRRYPTGNSPHRNSFNPADPRKQRQHLSSRRDHCSAEDNYSACAPHHDLHCAARHRDRLGR
jgi:hypothetical protein